MKNCKMGMGGITLNSVFGRFVRDSKKFNVQKVVVVMKKTLIADSKNQYV